VQKKQTVPDFFVSSLSAAFRKRYFPGVPEALWNDWHWQVRNGIRSCDELTRILHLSDDEKNALEPAKNRLPLLITPYYASLMDPADPLQPIRRTMVPVTAELIRSPGEQDDPLSEEPYTPVPGLVHRYPDRVLFLVSDVCAGYCRYCTRSRLVGRRPDGAGRIMDRWNAGIEYIASNPRIRDILISGGDPLMLSDERLEWLLQRLSAIPHVEILRIGTKVPATLPQRITFPLVRMLKRYQPLWMNIHCTHPDELTEEMREACRRLADAGIPLQSQTVLLAGVNDRTATLMDLFHELLRMRVRPYYLFQCDPISGSGHFRTPLAAGLSIMQELRGYTTGFAVPLYVIDTPGGGGKIPVMPECVMGQEGDTVVLKNFEGKLYRYRDNAALSHALLDRRWNEQ
ncbi:MAG TPA: KamA family radical SAM protein, partial [Deltaproteobacteria bacterium]|nr:KamA family radical SAM protein [Deltaproteobacteria bacterium]